MIKDRSTFVKRSDKVNFMEVEDGTFNRMKGFTAMSMAKNPIEYERQYVDETFETADVVGMSPSLEFEMDQRAGDPVHDVIVDIVDEEKLGDDAIVTILSVDFTQEGVTTDSFKARKRRFALVPETEGDSLEAYTYAGTFKTKGEIIKGKATSTDDWKTCTFTEGEGDPGEKEG